MAFSAGDTYWLLSDIRATARKLTGRPSVNQLSNQELDTYINRFYTQELMAILKLDDLASWWRFSTMEQVGEYDIPANVASISGLITANGDAVDIYTDPKVFNSLYQESYSTQESLGTGTGAATNFTGTLNKTKVNSAGMTVSDDQETLLVRDFPLISGITNASPAVVTTDLAHNLTSADRVRLFELNAGMEKLTGVETAVTVLTSTTFSLDNVDTSDTDEYTPYQSGGEVHPTSVALLVGDQGGTGRVVLGTGAYNVTFAAAPTDSQDIQINYNYPNLGKPSAVLHYAGNLLFSPSPDGPYSIEVAIDKRPEPLVNETDGIDNNDWGELVAYGASRVLLLDYGQMELAQMLQPRFMELQVNAMRKDLRSRSNNRSTPSF